MKKKVIYEASDGKGFESYLECEDYERELKKQHDNAVLSDAVNILIDLDKNFWAKIGYIRHLKILLKNAVIILEFICKR